MSKQRLGRGLSNLIPDTPVAKPKAAPEAPKATGSGLQDVALDLIRKNPNQPRKDFDAAKLKELVDSVSESGVLTPILLRPEPGGTYMLIAGERRFRAAGLAGLDSIPALVRRPQGTEELLWAMAENMVRDDLGPLEKANGLAELKDQGLKVGQIAAGLGISHAAVSNALRMLDLEPEIQSLLEDGVLSEGHTRPLLSLKERAQRLGLAKEIADKGLSVRASEARAKALREPPKGKKTTESMPEALKSVQDRLERVLATRVRIQTRSKGGTLAIHFNDNDDLSRLLDLMEREF